MDVEVPDQDVPVDFHPGDPISMVEDTSIYEKALFEMIFNDFCSLRCYSEGDGWNEPYSEAWSCVCEDNEPTDLAWAGIEWVQKDKNCTDRPEHEEIFKQWLEHVNKTKQYYA